MKIPASYHQERLWFIDKFENGVLYEAGPVYHNIPLILKIEGPLDIKLLERSIEDVITRHEALRTVIVTEEEKPFQLLNQIENFNLSILDLTGDEDTVGYDKAISIAFEEIERPFVLHEGPLIRGQIIRCGRREYILSITVHHIIADRYSLGILQKEIFSYYDAYIKEQPPELPGPALQYADFSQWQRNLPPKLTESLLGYWKSKLTGRLQALELPQDNPRKPIHTYQGKRQAVTLPEELSRRIKAFGEKTGNSDFVTLLAAFKVLLYKYARHEEIVVGISAPNRSQPGLDAVIGPFANLLVTRDSLADELPFTQFLAAMAKTVEDAYKHQHMPFDKLVLELNPHKDMSRTAFFDVLFQYEETPAEIPPVENVNITTVETNLGWGKYDLNILLQDKGESLSGVLVYNSEFFDDSAISRMIGHYIVLLDGILENPGRGIARYPILSGREKEQLLAACNQPRVNYPENKTIHELFSEQAQEKPGSISVSAPDSGDGKRFTIAISYRHLNNEAQRLAALLRTKGVTPDTIVPIIMERSVDMIIAMLGILNAGGAYLPIDPGYPRERIDYMLADSHARVLIAHREYPHKHEAVEVLGFDDFKKSNPQSLRQSLPSPPAGPNSLAYVIYTSGTTGKPKGVLLEHKNVVRLLVNDRFQFDFSSADVWTMFHSYCFDFSVWEMYGALLYGGKLLIIPGMVARDTGKFLEILKQEGVTVLNQTPSAFYNLMEQESNVPGDASGAPALRYVVFGGEALSPARLKRWHAAYPGTRLINMYGITETTVHVTFKEITPEDIAGNISKIGKPIPTLETVVLDRRLMLQPAGIPGECCVGGGGVARGYLNRPELTAEKFINNPYKPGKKLYRSGDLVKMRDNGEMDYLGRIDRQVKIRGFRIELAEIEARLSNCPGIKDAAVMDRDDQKGNTYLCAYIVADADFTVSRSRAYLSRWLPDYMIPLYFIPLEQIPLNSNGKVDRHRLPEPGIQEPGGAAGGHGPRNVIEKELADIWQNVLGINNVSIDDDFFEIGGDSIKILQVISRMKSLGYTLEMKDIFSNPLISKLAPFVKKTGAIVHQGAVTGDVPLTAIQQWFFQHKTSGSDHFNQAVMLNFKEGLREESVHAVFSKLQEHHDALRMTFKKKNETIIQENRGLEHPLSVRVFDYRDQKETPGRVENDILGLQAGIDLETGPLMKLGLFHRDGGDYLLIVVHHLVIDGVSWRILLDDIDTLYRQYSDGEPLVLPLKTDSFKTWSEKICRLADSRQFLNEKSYWARLESTPVPEIGKDFENDDNYIRDIDTLTFSLNEEDTHLLLTKANEAFGTGIADLLLTALGLTVKKIYGIDLLLIALEGHGREEIVKDVDINRTVGWFTSLYPVLLDFSNEPGETDEINLSRIIREVKEQLRRVPHKGVGYGILKYITSEEHKKDITFRLKPRVLFNYLGQFDEGLRSSCFRVEKEPVSGTRSPDEKMAAQLEFSGIITGKRLTMSVSYSHRQYKTETIADLSENFKKVLTRIIAYCTSRKDKVLTPSDFTYPSISIETLDRLQNDYSYLIEDIYPLTPLQEGMLFHTLFEEGQSAYLNQISHKLHKRLDIPLVEKSANELFKRFDILRTAFVYQGIERPLQLVLKRRQVDFSYFDIGKPAGAGDPGKKDEKKNVMEEFRKKDRQRLFNPGKDVMLRLAIFRLDDARYEFTWSFHHILMDGWCLGILITEFFEIYNSFMEKRTPRLPAVIPYKKYIEWLEKRDKENSKAYWTQYLAGYEETAGIPTLKKEAESHREHENVVLTLETGKSRALDKLAGRNQVTLNTLINAVWSILLGKYNRRQDVVFGTVVSGRPPEMEGAESMVGLFINTIPVRVHYERTAKFRDLLRAIQGKALDSEPHHYYPLVEIQAQCFLKQNLLDHIIVFENYPEVSHETALSDLEIFQQTNYDFNIIVVPGEQLSLKLEFNGNKYDSDFTRGIAGQFSLVFDQIIIDEDLAIEELTLLSEKEKRRLIFDFNKTDAAYPGDKTIHELFREQVERSPGNIAAEEIDTGRSMSYKELNRKADQLSVLLKEKGMVPGDIAVIIGERSLEIISGILAVLKAGGTYLPLDAKNPGERIKYILEDSRACFLLTQKKKIEPLRIVLQEFHQDRIIALDEEEIYKGDGINAYVDIPANAPAYIIYTSGTTGKPKGVIIQHGSLVNYIVWAVKIYFKNEPLNFPFYTSIGFDLTVTSIFAPLISGSTVIVYGDRDEGNMIERIIDDNKADIIKSTPSHLYMIQGKTVDIPGCKLKVFIVGGEALGSKLAGDIVNNFSGNIEIYNEYGPTEATVGCMQYRFSPQKDTGKSVSIGTPADNTHIYILDPYLNPLPVGAVGELCVSGAGLARGYLNRQELTAEKFNRGAVPSLISPLYRTGDLARWLPGGDIELLGRIDHQVKIRGFRIELNEIESTLLRLETVKEAVVRARKDDDGITYLAAYLVTEEELDTGELRTRLKEMLPSHMIPSYFVRVDRIPLTPNGKVNGKVLDSYRNTLDTGAEGAAPGNETEKTIADIWMEVLQVDRVGVHDSFFDIGGHSLSLVKVNGKLKKAFGIDITLAEMFRYTTIAALADYFRREKSGEGAVDDKIAEKEIDESVDYMEEAVNVLFLDEIN